MQMPDQMGHSQYTYYYQPGQASSQHASYAYYQMPSAGRGNTWPPSYSAENAYYMYGQPQAMPQPAAARSTHAPIAENIGRRNGKARSVSPSPSPPPRLQEHWDGVIRAFLSSAGLTQALRAFNADMVMISPDWERKKIPAALDALAQGILTLKEHNTNASPDGTNESSAEEHSLEARKLQYLHVADGVEPKSQTSITREISKFLARNRARNDASNRQEFLQSIAEKRHSLETGSQDSALPSCARTDAKTQNRDVQIKYDIAKNDDGPLRKTLKTSEDTPTANATEADPEQSYASAARFPGLDERLRNVESHLAVRYVPSPPKSLLDRLKFLEDHIVQLEKEYPPWAALHFNQPRRGWPPPPRPTPIIVPSHLTSTASHESRSGSQGHPHPAPTALPASATSSSDAMSGPLSAKGKGKSGRTKSSLHRAVMEKLEVQKAIHDLAGSGDGG
ncbi:hypothetical protein DAEQUDRAFT_744139 [Daedalea quercina L-15889]|uniref:Uncharacterized protein n=1 Tax=Daedalea quercina L-15889 TaxID=1314783 RepID=A0A165SD80_9APHY|nr:hypothetical protein DAEQUDRAFT_744139 [Daedalea quercina L-15889]